MISKMNSLPSNLIGRMVSYNPISINNGRPVFGKPAIGHIVFVKRRRKGTIGHCPTEYFIEWLNIRISTPTVSLSNRSWMYASNVRVLSDEEEALIVLGR